MFLIFKIVGGFLLIGASFIGGCFYSKKLYKRQEFFSKFLVFMNTFITHIRYESSDVFTLVSTSAENAGLNCLKIEQSNNIKSFQSLWDETVSNIPNIYSLKKEDYRQLIEFGSEIGKTDVGGQIKHIELYKNIFAKQLINAEEDIKQKSRLYKVLGLFVGTVATLMLM